KQAILLQLVDAKSIHALGHAHEGFPKCSTSFLAILCKVHEHKAINIILLLLLQGRGGAILCAYNQAGVDTINVFLRDSPKLHQDNGGLKPQQKLFNVTLIKIIFALASRTPSLNVVCHSPMMEYPAVIYKIWCAGISPDILGLIEQQQVGVWDSLLQASYSWKELYKTTSEVTANLQRSAIPGVARDVGHYSHRARQP
ncbi:hypothetical protein L208DRAFT_1394618, partial [Tricholoma matsutake]